jgi:hypothetical protein
MRKPLVALAAGAGVFALVAAGAATLTVTGDVPAAGTSAACDTDGVTVAYGMDVAGENITSIDVTDINVACNGIPITVFPAGTYTTKSTGTVATGAYSVTSLTVPVADLTSARVLVGNYILAS